MSLKELIRSLIAPLSARPKSKFYQTITPVSGQSASYTMPVDGWVQLYGENPTGTSQTVQLWGGERLATSTTVQSPAAWSSSAIGFYRKGDLIFYSISGFSEMSLNIFALVGGGVLSYFATFGGGLWLRLNHFLSRFSSSLVAKRSPAVNTKVLAKRLTTIGVNNTLPHLTATSSFGETMSSLYKLVTLPEAFRYVRNVSHPLVQCFPLRKAKYSTHQLATRVQPCLFTDSIRALAQPSPCFEGCAL